MQSSNDAKNAPAADCGLAEGFSIKEKVWAQTSFFAMGIAGTLGIGLADWPWLLPYVVFYWYAVPGVIMRHLVCPRCPHLHVFNDCLQLPALITKRLVKHAKTPPFSRMEKLAFCFIFMVIPLYPLYWLYNFPTLLIIFIASASAWYGGQFLLFCKYCRVKSCPFNRTQLI